jgi:hypothetical protein
MKFKLPDGRFMAYLSYPFSSNPKGHTEKVCRYAKILMERYPNMFIIVPHSAVDYTLYGPPREKITDYEARDHTIAAQLEFTILSKIDLFIQGVPDNPAVSMGCIWEHSFVQWINSWRKKKIIIVTLEELFGEKPDEWKESKS